MRPKDPLGEPLDITRLEGEVVFIGAGGVNFSMTVMAAQATLQRLIEALEAITSVVVLLVDDEPLVRQLGAAVLHEAGYEVIQAQTAAEALVALETRGAVDLLFTDVRLTGEADGLELAREVGRRWPAVRQLLCSGHLWPGAADLPADAAFLHKPYIAAEMLRRVDELTGA